LFNIGTPRGTSKIDFRIGNLGSTEFAPPTHIVLEKFDLLSTLRAGNVEDVPWFPKS
jgi:hypothetical protein